VQALTCIELSPYYPALATENSRCLALAKGKTKFSSCSFLSKSADFVHVALWFS